MSFEHVEDHKYDSSNMPKVDPDVIEALLLKMNEKKAVERLSSAK
jgi:hypothetical protein